VNPQEQIVGEVLHREREIEALRARVERLRAESLSALNVQEDRVNEIEAHLLRGHLQPLSHDPPPPMPKAAYAPDADNCPALFEEIRCNKARQRNMRHTMLEHPDTLPPGGKVIGIRHLEFFHDCVDYGPMEDQRRRDDEPEPEMEGHVHISNAVMTPSMYHSPEWLSQQGLLASLSVELLGEEGYPVNVYPVTRPPPAMAGINMLDSARPWDRPTMTWRAKQDHLEARACNLVAVRDEVTGEVSWRSTAPPARR